MNALREDRPAAKRGPAREPDPLCYLVGRRRNPRPKTAREALLQVHQVLLVHAVDERGHVGAGDHVVGAEGPGAVGLGAVALRLAGCRMQSCSACLP